MLFKFLRPLSGCVEHTQNLGLSAFYPVWHDIGWLWNNQFQYSPNSPWSTQFRVISKLVDGMPYRLRHFPGSTSVVSGNIVLNMLQQPWLRVQSR